ncbi:hypothetical protein RI054_32g125420 [Pseudoscourfieldia marina]
MASGNNDDIQNLNAFLGVWSAAVARMTIPSDATRAAFARASAVDFRHAACYRAARRLLGILPPEAIAFPLGIDVSQLTRHGVAPTLTIHLRLAATFAPDTIVCRFSKFAVFIKTMDTVTGDQAGKLFLTYFLLVSIRPTQRRTILKAMA